MISKSNMSDSYLPIRINTLRANADVNFDVFILVGQRHLHYIRESEPLEGDRIKRLKEKGVKKLFIPEAKESQYLLYLDAGLKTLSNKNEKVEVRAAIANDSMVTSAENVERALDSEQGMQRTEKQMGSIIEFLMSDKGAIKSILSGAGASQDIFQHAATVSSLALAVATRMEIDDQRELTDMGVAALVHDLGKTRMTTLDPLKPREEFSPEEKKLYEKHPAESIALLSGKPMITPHVLGLVANHDELPRGRGFPERKDLNNMKLPYQIFNMVNQFDRYCLEKKTPHAQGVDGFYEKYGELFDADLIGTLATALT